MYIFFWLNYCSFRRDYFSDLFTTIHSLDTFLKMWAFGLAIVFLLWFKGNQPGDGVVMTKPGNLAAKHIIHMVGQTKSKDIISSMLKVFKMCEDHKIQSVSFPALGTGRLTYCRYCSSFTFSFAIKKGDINREFHILFMNISILLLLR